MLYSNKDLKKLIIPLVIEQTLAIAVGMADTIMISVVGEAAVSGVSLVDTVNILLINVFSALATGGAVVAGHFLGQNASGRGEQGGLADHHVRHYAGAGHIHYFYRFS